MKISTDGEVLIVSPIRDEQRRKRFEEALEKTSRRYSHALKWLAE